MAEREFGLSDQSLQSWLSEGAVNLVVTAIGLAIFAVPFYLLLRRAHRLWWLWATVLVAASLLVITVLQPVFLEPLFNDYAPAPEGEIRDAVAELAATAGISEERIFIYDGSKQSNRYTANVAGLCGTARIAMSDVMFAEGADVAEVRGVIGHEISHYVHNDVVVYAGAIAVLALVTFVLVDKGFGRLARILGARRVENIRDPAGFPVLVAALAAVSLTATPLVNSMVRYFETRADDYSVELTHEPDGLARALIKDCRIPQPDPDQDRRDPLL